MARLGIGTGTNANDGSGDNLRAAGGKINDNFSEIYNYFGDGTNLNFVSGSWNVVNSGINTLSSVGIGTTNPRFTLEVGAVGASGTSLFVNGDAGVTGNVNVSGVSTFAGNITVNGNIAGDDASNISGINSATATSLFGDHLVVSGISTFLGKTRILDDVEFHVGTNGSSGEYKFYRDSGNTLNVLYEDISGAEARFISNLAGDSNSAFNFLKASTALAKFTVNGAKLYSGGVLKLETTGGGISVTGTSTCTGSVQVGSGQSFGSSTGSAAVYYGDGSSLTGPSRSDVSAATGSIGIGTTTNISITAHKSYGLLKVGISSAAWVRLYVDEASRTSDANRSYLVDPAAGSGLIAEVRTETTGISTFLMTPGVIGWNNDVSVGSTVYAAVTNNETESANITVTLSVVRIEG